MKADQTFELRAFECETREPVLRHFEAGARRTHLPPRSVTSATVIPDCWVTTTAVACQGSMQRVDQLLLLCSVQRSSPTLWPTVAATLADRLHMDPRGASQVSPEDPVRLSQKFKPSDSDPAGSRRGRNGCQLPSHAGELFRPSNPTGPAISDRCALANISRSEVRKPKALGPILLLSEKAAELIVQLQEGSPISSFTPGPMVELKETFFM